MHLYLSTMPCRPIGGVVAPCILDLGSGCRYPWMENWMGHTVSLVMVVKRKIFVSAKNKMQVFQLLTSHFTDSAIPFHIKPSFK